MAHSPTSRLAPTARVQPGSPALIIPRKVRLRVSPEQFWEFCRANPDLRLERTATGKLIVMAPAGSESGGINAGLVTDLNIWARADRTGKVFDSSAGFTLPNGAIVGPDVAWIKLDRWLAVPAADRRKFAPICPDFVAELRSPSDSMPKLRVKMRQYVEQGVRLGWLLDPMKSKVEIYRPDQAVQVLDRPVTLSGEGVLPGFVLDLRGILDDLTGKE